jgi:HSP20 family protein
MSVIQLRPFSFWGVPARAVQNDSDWTPSADVRETADAFVLALDVPGVDPKAIEITVEDGVLTLSGARNGESEGDELLRRERASGRFVRRFSLPDTVNAEAVTAKSTHGVLTLTVPKRAEVQPRRIELQAA